MEIGTLLTATESFDCYALYDEVMETLTMDEGYWVDGTSFPTETEVRVLKTEDDGIFVEDENGNIFFVEEHSLHHLSLFTKD